MISRRDAPEVLHFVGPPKTEGAGKTGCAPHPRSRVQCASKNAHTSIQVWRRRPAFPAQWLYGLYEFALVTGFLATITSFGFRLRSLDASTGASGPHDFTVRNGCARLSHHRVHRSLPRVCDDGRRPSGGTGCGIPKVFLPDGGSGIFLAGGLDPHLGVICPSGCD